MIIAFYASKSGAKNYQTCLDATADNIANLNTDGYKAHRVAFADLLYDETENKAGQIPEAAAGFGSKTRLSRDLSEGILVPGEGTNQTEPVEKSNVDLVIELTGMMTAQRGFQVNLQMLKTADEIEQYANHLKN